MKSSVEWLDNAIKDLIPNDIRSQLKYKNKIEQAKEMHKEEAMDAFQAGKWYWSVHVNHGKNSMDPAEYYNETFKND